MNRKLVIALAISSALTPFAASADTLNPNSHNLDYLYLNGNQDAEPLDRESVFDKVFISIGSAFGTESEPAEVEIINDTERAQEKAPIWKESEPKQVDKEEPVNYEPVQTEHVEPVKAEDTANVTKAAPLEKAEPAESMDPEIDETVATDEGYEESVLSEPTDQTNDIPVASSLIAPGFFVKLDTQSLLFTTDIDDNEIFGTAELGIGAGYRFIIDSHSSSFVDIYATKNIGIAMDTIAQTDLDGFGVGVMYGNKFDSYEKMHWTVDAEFVQKDIQDTTTNGMTLSYGVLYPVTPQFAVSTSVGVAVPFNEPTDLLSSIGFSSKLGITYTF